MRSTLPAALATLLIAGPLTAAARPAEHGISLDRLPARGSSWDVRVDARLEERAVSIVGGERRVVETVVTAVVLDAVAEVGVVDGAGVPTAVSYVVNECTLTRNGVTTIIAESGQTLHATLVSDDETRFSVTGRTMQPGWSAALQLVAGLGDPADLRDAVFGSSVPRAIGESWPVEDGLATGTAAWAESGRARFEGETTLREVRRRDEMDCLRLEADLDVTGTPAVAGLPGLEATESRWTLHLESLLPVDESLPAVEETSRLHAQLILKGLPETPHEGAAMLLTSNRIIHRTRTLHAAPGFAAARGDRPE